MSAATSTNCGTSTMSTVRIQHQRESACRPYRRSTGSSGGGSGGGGGGNVKRVSWKLANMAAIATPESDDDFDVIDVSCSSPHQLQPEASDDRCAAFYHVTQDGAWVMTAARDELRPRATPNGADSTGNGVAENSPSSNAIRRERAWAVVAVPAQSTSQLQSRNPVPDEKRVDVDRRLDVDEHVSYVVTTTSSIARPENGPQLLYRPIPESDDQSIRGEAPEPEVVEKTLAVTLSASHNHHFFGNDQTCGLSTMADCGVIDESSSADSGFGATVNDTQFASRSCYQSTNDDEVDFRVSIHNDQKGRRRPISSMTTTAMGSETDRCDVVLVPRSQISSKHFVVVAIDFGTALSGYAFGFVRDPGRSVHMMRRWEGGDPGVVNQKTPTALLLDPEGRFHSFGCAARDFYHDLDDDESRTWMYFDRFKMALHHDQNLNRNTTLTAANGRQHPALAVFAHALRYFREHAVRELADQSSTSIVDDDVRWVITVPAIWRPAAKQFMRQAAIEAGMTSADNPERLLIALEPEAASVYVRTLRLYQLVPDSQINNQSLSPRNSRSSCYLNEDYILGSNRLSRSLSRDLACDGEQPSDVTVEQDAELAGARCMVVDCGGGTVDITVHEVDPLVPGRLHEVYKATGGPYGSVGVDLEFEKLLANIFGVDFIESYKRKRPSGWVDLMVAFESRKRSANPFKDHPLNICLPFSFIDYHKKHKGTQVETAINKYGDKAIRWSSQGMLRLTLDAMKRLFTPTLEQIKRSIAVVIDNVHDVGCMFLVGGFAESPILQQDVRSEFGDTVKIFVPQDVALTVLKGAVYFGLDPAVVTRRRSMMTYGVEVLNRFNASRHPSSKLVQRGGQNWCTGVFDVFVKADQDIDLGQTITRCYGPPSVDQRYIVINIYSSERPDVQFVTDPGVVRCGQLRLDFNDRSIVPDDKKRAMDNGQTDGRLNLPPQRRREIQTRMTFGDTEIKVSAVDVTTGRCVLASVDFFGHV